MELETLEPHLPCNIRQQRHSPRVRSAVLPQYRRSGARLRPPDRNHRAHSRVAEDEAGIGEHRADM